MNQTKYTHCMTLRLEPQLEAMVTEAAYSHRITKSDWIRAAIRHRLASQWATEQITGARRSQGQLDQAVNGKTP